VVAASKGFIEITKILLLRFGANPFLRNNYGESAFDLAALAEHVSNVICFASL
jgi:ankyrin repeat protein